MSDLSQIINQTFKTKTVVIVGDLVADQFLRGTIARVSREAPVFILRHDETDTLAGGAANAATNVASLGAKAVLVGVLGTDEAGTTLLDRLAQSGVDCSNVVVSDTVKTTTKVRVLAGQQYAARQQVIRIDYENNNDLGEAINSKLRGNLQSAVESADAVIISDYDYGVARNGMASLAKDLCAKKNIPLLVDSRFRLKDFSGATSATPNQDEVEQILGEDFDDAGCDALRERLGYKSLLVTRGNKGMLLCQAGSEPVGIDAVGAKEPVDVTGAGDTVIAAYALGLASGLGFLDAAAIANHAGGIVVMKKGTASVSPDELTASLGSK